MNSADEDEVMLSVQRDSVRREWSRANAAPPVRRQRGTRASLLSNPPPPNSPGALVVESVAQEPPPPPPVDPDAAFRRGRIGVVAVVVLVLFWVWLRQRR